MDTDSKMLASDPMLVTELALALHVAMSSSASARAAYAELHGEEWAPCAALAEAFEIESKSYAPTTFAATRF
jgi:hypothetical protein